MSSPLRIVGRLAARGRVHYLGMLASDYGRMILTRKYDAFSTDYAYENRPRGLLGPVGKAMDALVLRFPLHAALRQRLALVVPALVEAVRAQAGAGASPVRVLSAPCGLARDVITAASRIDAEADAPRVRLIGLDIDESGDVLPEAARRAARAGVSVELLREDLFAAETRLAQIVARDGPFHVANCIGLTAWVDAPDVARLLRRFAGLLAPGGSFIVDNWRRHKHSRLGDYMEMPTRYHPESEFRALLEDAGFEALSLTPTSNGICSIWTGRRAG